MDMNIHTIKDHNPDVTNANRSFSNLRRSRTTILDHNRGVGGQFLNRLGPHHHRTGSNFTYSRKGFVFSPQGTILVKHAHLPAGFFTLFLLINKIPHLCTPLYNQILCLLNNYDTTTQNCSTHHSTRYSPNRGKTGRYQKNDCAGLFQRRSLKVMHHPLQSLHSPTSRNIPNRSGNTTAMLSNPPGTGFFSLTSAGKEVFATDLDDVSKPRFESPYSTTDSSKPNGIPRKSDNSSQ